MLHKIADRILKLKRGNVFVLLLFVLIFSVSANTSEKLALNAQSQNLLAQTSSVGNQDLNPPVIILNGEDSVLVYIGDTYVEQGATAFDDLDGDLTSSIDIYEDTVDWSTAGTYSITYVVEDEAGNTSYVVRKVKVVDPQDTAGVDVIIGAVVPPVADNITSVEVYGDRLEYVTGVYLLKPKAGGSVETPLAFSDVTSNRLVAYLPSNMEDGVYDVRLVYPGGNSSLKEGVRLVNIPTVYPDPPIVKTIQPYSVRVGDKVTLTGSNFSAGSHIEVVNKDFTLQADRKSGTELTFIVSPSLPTGLNELRINEKVARDGFYSNTFKIDVQLDEEDVVDTYTEDVVTNTYDSKISDESLEIEDKDASTKPTYEETAKLTPAPKPTNTTYNQDTVVKDTSTKDAVDESKDADNVQNEEVKSVGFMDTSDLFKEVDPDEEQAKIETQEIKVSYFKLEDGFNEVIKVEQENKESYTNDSSNIIYDDGARKLTIEYSVDNEGVLDNIKRIAESIAKEEKTLFENRKNRSTQDADKDGISDYDEVVIYKTNPFSAKTVEGELSDSEKILAGINPLSPSAEPIRFQNPKTAVKSPVIEELRVDTLFVTETKLSRLLQEEIIAKIEFTGTALPNSYVTLYIFSTPIIVTVKADSEGRWTYELDKELEDGNHEVYVATVDNSGKIVAKSNPIPFVKQANAASLGSEFVSVENPNFLRANFVYIIMYVSLFGLLLMLFLVGSDYRKIKEGRLREENVEQHI